MSKPTDAFFLLLWTTWYERWLFLPTDTFIHLIVISFSPGYRNIPCIFGYFWSKDGCHWNTKNVKNGITLPKQARQLNGTFEDITTIQGVRVIVKANSTDTGLNCSKVWRKWEIFVHPPTHPPTPPPPHPPNPSGKIESRVEHVHYYFS